MLAASMTGTWAAARLHSASPAHHTRPTTPACLLLSPASQSTSPLGVPSPSPPRPQFRPPPRAGAKGELLRRRGGASAAAAPILLCKPPAHPHGGWDLPCKCHRAAQPRSASRNDAPPPPPLALKTAGADRGARRDGGHGAAPRGGGFCAGPHRADHRGEEEHCGADRNRARRAAHRAGRSTRAGRPHHQPHRAGAC